VPTLNWIGKETVVNHHQLFHLSKDVIVEKNLLVKRRRFSLRQEKICLSPLTIAVNS
jgi:hypothetical protein